MYNFKNFDAIINENRRINQLNTTPRTIDELLGKEGNASFRGKFTEKQEPSEAYKQMLYANDSEWNQICKSNVYAHIRLCGRRAQIASEDRAFLMDDLFRLYGFGTSTKFDYNKEANLWVFYIGCDIAGERDKYVWVQTPNSVRARKFVFNGLSSSNGLLLKSNKRDISAYERYVMPYKEELKELSVKYYDVLRDSFKQVSKNFAELAGRVEDLPQNSMDEWPFGGLLFL